MKINSNNKKQVNAQTMIDMKKELEYLKKVKRKEIAEQLNHAISFGDLKENAAYHEAKEAQAFLEGKIMDLNYNINNSVIVDNQGKNKISLGSKITVIMDNQEQEYVVVSSRDGDPLNNKISIDSPIGKVVLGKSKGDKCKIETPSGQEIELEILEIK